MSDRTSIGWTDATWNPVTGCTKVSEGCANCYAERMALRLYRMGTPKYSHAFCPTLHTACLDEPLRWRKPRMVFVCSMGDLFHEAVPLPFIRDVFDVMEKAERHTFQVLTKRARRMRDLSSKLPWPVNVWAGVTVENARHLDRVKALRRVPAYLRFVSAEPLLGPLWDLDLGGIRWVIVGGETGPGARQMQEAWANDVLANCRAKGVPFFFKQWGGHMGKYRILSGRTWDEVPDDN